MPPPPRPFAHPHTGTRLLAPTHTFEPQLWSWKLSETQHIHIKAVESIDIMCLQGHMVDMPQPQGFLPAGQLVGNQFGFVLLTQLGLHGGQRHVCIATMPEEVRGALLLTCKSLHAPALHFPLSSSSTLHFVKLSWR